MLVYRSAQEIPHPARVGILPAPDPAFPEAELAPDAVPAPSGAFPVAAPLRFRLGTARALLAVAATLELTDDDTGATRSFPFTRAGETASGASFALDLPASAFAAVPEAPGGLYFYTVRLETPYGAEYLSLTPDGGQELVADPGAIHRFQVTLYTPPAALPRWLFDGVIYHIFVDRFRRAGSVPVKPDAVVNPDWERGIPEYAPVPGGYVENNEFFGGTLFGVTEQLDALAALGVNCIYLSPIFDAHSNHKYDTGDYETVDTMFGGEDALRTLCTAAKRRGIGVILDGVFNHTGADSRYFNRDGNYPGTGAYQSPASPYAAWYTFYDYPDRYRCWWGIPILPAINTGNASYRAYICGENGIAAKWMRAGVSGFRLDVADELSDLFLDEFTARVKAEKPDAVVFGEVWEDASDKIAYDRRRRYFRGGQLDGVMNYPLRTALIAFVRDGDAAALAATAETLWQHYPRFVSASLMNLLGTHDTERILNVLSGADASGKTNAELSTLRLTPAERATALERLRPAYLALAFLPGNPCVYYGDEAGAEGWRDPFNRLPYPWGREDAGLLRWYRRIGTLRRRFPWLGVADFAVTVREAGTFAFVRTAAVGRILCAINRGAGAYPLALPGEWEDLLIGEPVGGVRLLPPGGMLLAHQDVTP